jgi:hypothetical protein
MTTYIMQSLADFVNPADAGILDRARAFVEYCEEGRRRSND